MPNSARDRRLYATLFRDLHQTFFDKHSRAVVKSQLPRAKEIANNIMKKCLNR